MIQLFLLIYYSTNSDYGISKITLPLVIIIIHLRQNNTQFLNKKMILLLSLPVPTASNRLLFSFIEVFYDCQRTALDICSMTKQFINRETTKCQGEPVEPSQLLLRTLQRAQGDIGAMWFCL